MSRKGAGTGASRSQNAVRIPVGVVFCHYCVTGCAWSREERVLRRVPVHGYIYKKHRALLRALRVEKQKEPAQWMRRCGFRTGGPMGLPQLQVPRPLHCKGQRASGRFHPGPYRPGFRRRRAVLWQLAELGMGSGGRRASQSDAAHPGGFYGTDAPEEYPRSCLLVRRVVLEASGGIRGV